MLALLRAFVCHSQKRCCRYLVCRNHGLMARSLPLLRGLQRSRCLGCRNQNGAATPGVRQLLRRRSFGGPEAKAPVNCPKAKRLWGDRHRGRRRCNPWEAHLRRTRLTRSSCADDVDGRHVSGQEEGGKFLGNPEMRSRWLSANWTSKGSFRGKTRCGKPHAEQNRRLPTGRERMTTKRSGCGKLEVGGMGLYLPKLYR